MKHTLQDGSGLPVTKPKSGCVGCFTQLTILFILGSITVLIVMALLAPWGFYLGGKFHVIPDWQGWARLHSKISGDYVVYMNIWATKPWRYNSVVTGTGYVCTPRGERIRMNLVGTMRLHLNTSTDGEHIYIKIYNGRPFNFNSEKRPRLEFLGHWQNPNLVMNDDGSISRAFQPDGSVYLGHDPNRPYKLEVIPVTFKQGPYSEFESACRTIHH